MPVRRLPLLLAAALAAAPLAAQKPGADDAERERYRGQGISMCVAELRAVEGFTPDALEAVCGCALERVMAGHDTASLPAIRPGPMDARVAGPMVACAAEQLPELGIAAANHVAAATVRAAQPPPVTLPLPREPDKPVQETRPAAASGPAFDPFAWLDGFALPGWLGGGGVPRWAWIPLGAFALLLLWLLFRRRIEDGRALDGPPPHMRPRAGPAPPRR